MHAGKQLVVPARARSVLPSAATLRCRAGVAGLLGAAFNSMRMWLWRLRASKTRHVLRIAEVIGLALLVVTLGFFLSWAAGRCIPKNPDWGDEYGLRFM